MNNIASITIAILIMMIFNQSATSQPRYVKTVEAEFEDVFFDLQQSVISKGLKIVYTGHVGKMLARTADAVNDGKEYIPIYKYAKYFQFCSATFTHKAIEKDPANLSMCPFVLYAYESVDKPGMVKVGYRNPDFGNLDPSDPLSLEAHEFLKLFVDETIADY